MADPRQLTHVATTVPLRHATAGRRAKNDGAQTWHAVQATVPPVGNHLFLYQYEFHESEVGSNAPLHSYGSMTQPV
jgi:hypothetical protein